MPIGSQWCCSAASACTGRHKACVSSPSVMVLSAKGSSSYFTRYSSISWMDSGVRPGT